MMLSNALLDHKEFEMRSVFGGEELVVRNVFYDLLVRFAFLKDRNAKVASYTNSAVSLYVNSFQKRFSYDLSGLCLCIR